MRKSGAVLVGLLFGVVFCVLQKEDVSAVASVECKSNASTRNACSYGDGIARGALWLNTTPSNHNGAESDNIILNEDIESEYANIYLHGAVYGGSGTAQCVRITDSDTGEWGAGNSDCNTAPDNARGISGLSGNSSISRSNFPGELNSSYLTIRISLNWVRSSWENKGTDGDYQVYEKTLYAYRCFGAHRNSGACYSDPMTVTIKLKQFKIEATPAASISGTAYIGETKSGLSGSTSVSATGISNDKAASEYVRSENIAFYHDEQQNGSNFSAGEVVASDPAAARQATCQKFGGENCGSTMGFADNNGSVNIEDAESYVGKKLCVARATNVAHYQYSADGTRTKVWSNTWTVSAASCVEIAKKPNTAVVGNNAYAKNGFISSSTTKSGVTYGSWGEFLVATQDGTTKKLGSGSSLADGESGNFCNNLSTLTISNQTCSKNTAAAGGISSSNNFQSQIESLIMAGLTKQGNITVSSANDFTDSGQARVIYSSGDVTVNGNIINNNDGKQYIIFAKNVNISANVEQIDAWIIADSSVDTCTGATVGNLSANDCNKQLKINGLVYANDLKLKRTYGAGGGSGSVLASGANATTAANSASAAEIINLTPASYVWAAQVATTDYANPTTVYTRELAPRM